MPSCLLASRTSSAGNTASLPLSSSSLPSPWDVGFQGIPRSWLLAGRHKALEARVRQFLRNSLQPLTGSLGLSAISMIIMMEVCPNHLRQYISSLAGFVISGAGVVGPVLGGVLTHYVTWRWVFWVKYVLPTPDASSFTNILNRS